GHPYLHKQYCKCAADKHAAHEINKQYRATHKAERTACNAKYRATHKAEIAAYRATHKAEKATYGIKQWAEGKTWNQKNPILKNLRQNIRNRNHNIKSKTELLAQLETQLQEL
ncbi:MAG: hypothetical protein ABIW84_04170, partial [Ilumatobacteraceae bacterium]